MNTDKLHGKWMQIRGEAKRQWGKLTDDDLDQINGDMDRLIGKLQARYGYSRSEATREVEAFQVKYEKDSGKGY